MGVGFGYLIVTIDGNLITLFVFGNLPIQGVVLSTFLPLVNTAKMSKIIPMYKRLQTFFRKHPRNEIRTFLD